MAYALGLDIGTTSITAAAAVRGGGLSARVLALDADHAEIPSAVYFAEDGPILGAEAERRGASHPELLVREFCARIGDDVPIVAGTTAITAERLYAETVRALVERAAAVEGLLPSRVALSTPVGWPGGRVAIARRALVDAGLTDVVLVEQDRAAAAHAVTRGTYGRDEHEEHEERVIVVVDLGAVRLDVSVLRSDGADGWRRLAHERLDRVGGAAFDHLVLRHVARTADAFTGFDGAHPDADRFLAALRRRCMAGKETLSRSEETTIDVQLPTGRSDVRLTRPQFEGMIGPLVDAVAEAAARVHAGARLTPDDHPVVLLVGGSARIPLVARRVSERLGMPAPAPEQPRSSVALGLALVGGRDLAEESDGVADGGVPGGPEVTRRSGPREWIPRGARRGAAGVRRAAKTAAAAVSIATGASAASFDGIDEADGSGAAG